MERAVRVESVKARLAYHLMHTIGKDGPDFSPQDWLMATAHAVRDEIVERWGRSLEDYSAKEVKSVYYLSMEFLIGRSLTNNLIAMGLYDIFAQALDESGTSMAEIEEWEAEAALGNGGLGRLAACLLDSMAAAGVAGFGYGIRYEYGMFNQRIEQGWQIEAPEDWLRCGNPWELPRLGVVYRVRFGGSVIHYTDRDERKRAQWEGGEEVLAQAYDMPIVGHGGKTVNSLRLWSAKASREFDLAYFNQGNYIEAVKSKSESETISKVLYPSDMTAQGRELRLRQEYFFVAASIQDIVARFLRKHSSLDALPDHVAIQLNDTHPTLAIPELMRILVDDYRYDWDKAWDISRQTFAYTNHTLLPEALESWPVALFERLLPRHLQIIYEINHHFLNDVRHAYPGQYDLAARLSIIDEHHDRRIRMAHLAVIGSHKVNGVAQIHTHLMKTTLFADFERIYPQKIVNQTNGISPRRWLLAANPDLARLIGKTIGTGWVEDLQELNRLIPMAENEEFCASLVAIKQANKRRLAAKLAAGWGMEMNPDSMFDVMIKRMHEYKRQLLLTLFAITRYRHIRNDPSRGIVPRTILIAGKAAPGYRMAKLIVKLIHDVADTINNDPLIGGRLKLFFIPNYNVSLAERIIPAADLSEQISMAGTEASGTGNMKLALNGALTIGTWDGATVEIAKAVGDDNLFLFGLKAEEVARLKQEGYRPQEAIAQDSDLAAALEMIESGFFSPDDKQRFQPIIDALTIGGDHYMLTADYRSYLEAQNAAEDLFQRPRDWVRKTALTIARMGYFSSDRTINAYARDIWEITPHHKGSAARNARGYA